MILRVSNFAAATALAVVLASVAGCSAPEPQNAPPPPPPPQAYERSPADLAGGPPPAPRDQEALAGGPVYGAPAPPVTTMAPIANPEDLSPSERRRIYGDKYDAPRGAERRAAHRARADRAAPSVSAPAKSKTPAAAPSPTGAPPAVASAAPTALDPKLAVLQTALAAQVTTASVLTVDPNLAQGVRGPVTLILPQNLFDLIRAEAAKLGLGREVRSSEVTATLSGSGYEITPGGPQTATVKPGEAPVFRWQVGPGAGQPGALKADVEASLSGQGKTRTLPLLSLKGPAPAPPAAPARPVRWETLVGGGLVLIAILLMAALARNASETKNRARVRRARERALAETEPAAAPAKPAVPPKTSDKA